MRNWREGSEEEGGKETGVWTSRAATAGTDHALSSEELPAVHVHHADIGPWHVASGRTTLVVGCVKRSKDGVREMSASEADAAWFFLVTSVGHNESTTMR